MAVTLVKWITRLRKTALASIKKVMGQINAHGHGFMWIDYNPGKDYAFHTNWGLNNRASARTERNNRAS
jgi:hypothetical protein